MADSGIGNQKHPAAVATVKMEVPDNGDAQTDMHQSEGRQGILALLPLAPARNYIL